MHAQMDRTLDRIRNGYFTVATGWLVVAVAARAAGAPRATVVVLLTLCLATASCGIWWFQRVQAAVRSATPRKVLVSATEHRFGTAKVCVTLSGDDRPVEFWARTKREVTGELMTLYGDPTTHLLAVVGTGSTLVPLLPRPGERVRPLRPTDPVPEPR